MPFCWFCHEAAHIAFHLVVNYHDWNFTAVLLNKNAARQNKQNDMYAQRRLRSAWASTQSEVWSESSLCGQWIAKDPRLLHSCGQWRLWSDWSETSLVAQVIMLVLSYCGSLIVSYNKKSCLLYDSPSYSIALIVCCRDVFVYLSIPHMPCYVWPERNKGFCKGYSLHDGYDI